MASLRQERLAEALLDPTVKTKTEAMVKAGYAPTTIDRNIARTVGAVGTVTKSDSLKKRRLDSARGLVDLGTGALRKGASKLDEMSPQDQIVAGVKLVETGLSIGEEATPEGDADRHKAWKRRYGIKCVELGRRLERRAQDVVLSPDVIGDDGK